MYIHRTHAGEFIKGERVQRALAKVADDWEALARAIYVEDRYASHVTQETKDARLAYGLATAEKIRSGIVDNFTIWQRVNTELTGDCVALLK